MTATLRFTLDAARSAVVRPDLSMMIAGRSIEHYVQAHPSAVTGDCERRVPVHDPEPLAADEIEVWEPIELSLEEWPYEKPTSRKRVEAPWIPVVTDYRKPWPW